MHLKDDLLRIANGRLEGIVTTESGREPTFSGMLDPLRIIAAGRLPTPLSSGHAPTPRRPR